MLDLLYTNLRAVYKKLGASWTLKKSKSAANLEKADLHIVKLLSQSELIMDLEIVEASEEALDYPEKNEIEDLSLRINAGFFYYGHAQVKDKAYVLLQEIQDIEKQHDKAKKSAEAENKPLPPSISMKYIEDQIKLVKDFPVDGLLHEVEEVIAEISPVSNHRKMLREARDYIYDTSGAMVRERIEFWRKFHSLTSKGNGQDHSSNGLNETLDSLLNKFNSFKEQWEEKYAPFFTPHDRSDPKRQRIEQ